MSLAHAPETVTKASDEPRRAPRFTAGLADGLGDRVHILDEGSATPAELLRLKHEFGDEPAFEAALRERVQLLAGFRHPAIGIVRSVGRRGMGDGLTLVSDHIAGRRISEVMDAARGPAFALDFLNQIAPAVAALQQHGPGIAHGVLTVERIVVGREGRLAMVEHVLGSALAALKLPASRLRDELGLAVADSTGPVLLDARLDVVQLGFIALSLIVGERLPASDYPNKVGVHLDGFAKEHPASAAHLVPWLERALQIGDRPFVNASEAWEAFSALTGSGSDASKDLAAGNPVAASAHRTNAPSSVPAAAQPPRVSAPTALSAQAENAFPTERSTPVRTASSAPESDGVLVPAAGSSRLAPRPNWLAMGLGGVILIQAAVIAFLIYSQPVSVAGIVGEFPLPAIASAAPAESTAVPVPVAEAFTPAAGVIPTAAPLVAAAEPAPRPSQAEPALPTGSRVGGIRVSSPIELQVLEDGKVVGSTAGPIAVNDGSHTFELVNETLGLRLRQTVTIKPGQFTNLNVSVPNGRISINAAPWADVWIDGAAAGQTPLANLSLPIGSHEIVFRHPQLGEQRQRVDVKVEGLTRVSAILQK